MNYPDYLDMQEKGWQTDRSASIITHCDRCNRELKTIGFVEHMNAHICAICDYEIQNGKKTTVDLVYGKGTYQDIA